MVDVAGPNNRADGIFKHVYTYRDSGHFQHIPVSTVEFSNTFQHEYGNFPKYFFTHSGILQHFTTHIEESPLCWFLASDVCYFQSNSRQSRIMTKKLFQFNISFVNYCTLLYSSQFCLLFKIKSVTMALFYFFKIQIL
jgi:hypothetical protein